MSNAAFQDQAMQIYIRPTPTGARVFRLTLREDLQRLDMTYLTQVSLPDGRLHDRGSTRPTADERAAIASWVESQNQSTNPKDCPLSKAANALYAASEWLDTSASPLEAIEGSNQVFEAMHDLRNSLLWRMSQDGD